MQVKSFFTIFLLILKVDINAQTAPFNYEQKMISSGKNFPDFNLRRDSIDRLIVLLHEGKKPSKIQKELGWTTEKFIDQTAFLESKGFLKKTGKTYRPTCMVINIKDGNTLYKYAEKIAQAISDSLTLDRKFFTNEYKLTNLSKQMPFDSVSFLILSNVLLDNWQINNVEDDFLKKPRALRHGKNYYYAFMQKNPSGKSESFGIYGNQFFRDFLVYGNNRNHIKAAEVSKYAEKLPLVDSIDNSLFYLWADLFKSKLIKILNEHKGYIQSVYKKTGYAKEVTFEEFFIWWYHFIYTRATNILFERNLIIIPAEGNFFYRLK